MLAITKYLITFLATYSGLFAIAYSHVLIRASEELHGSMDLFFSHAYVYFLIGCGFSLTWGNVTNFEEYQKKLNNKDTFAIKIGLNMMGAAVLLMITATMF